MSQQQEFLPRSQQSAYSQEAEGYAIQPLPRQKKLKASETPKSEHPAAYEYDGGLSTYEYRTYHGYDGYKASTTQDQTLAGSSGQPVQTMAELQSAYSSPSQVVGTVPKAAPTHGQGTSSRKNNFEPDGDAFETHYRPYNHYTGRSQVPPWAKPQQNNFASLRFFIVFLLLGFGLPALFAIVKGVTVIGAALIGGHLLTGLFHILLLLFIFSIVPIVLIAVIVGIIIYRVKRSIQRWRQRARNWIRRGPGWSEF